MSSSLYLRQLCTLIEMTYCKQFPTTTNQQMANEITKTSLKCQSSCKTNDPIVFFLTNVTYGTWMIWSMSWGQIFQELTVSELDSKNFDKVYCTWLQQKRLIDWVLHKVRETSRCSKLFNGVFHFYLVLFVRYVCAICILISLVCKFLITLLIIVFQNSQ